MLDLAPVDVHFRQHSAGGDHEVSTIEEGGEEQTYRQAMRQIRAEA